MCIRDRRKADLDDRLYRMYDKIEDTESLLIAARAKKQAVEAEQLNGANIYKVLIYFEKLYGVMNDVERRQLIEALISEIQIYPERQPNGQWLKSIKFRLPIICLLYTSYLYRTVQVHMALHPFNV